MIPQIIASTATPDTLSASSLGFLGAAHSCRIKQVLNGQYELTMRFPVEDEMFGQLQLRNIILASADRSGTPQPFRIYKISKPIKGIVTVNARHIVYDLDGIVALPFSASTLATALAGLMQNSVNANPFALQTTRSTAAAFSFRVPQTIWQLLGGQQGSLLDVYGGEYGFNGWTVNLENRIGADNGVSVRYGVNMTDFEQDANCASCYTAVIAYWQDSEGNAAYGNVVNASGTYDHVRVLPLDLSEQFDTMPDAAALDAAAAAYITANDIGTPTVSWKVGFVPLDTTEEYKDLALLERVSLGDTVAVFFEKYNVSASSRVVEIEWDSLLDRYVSVTLGKVRSTIAKTMANVQQEVAELPTQEQVITSAESIAKALTGAILGAEGGAVRLLDTNDDGLPDTLYIADNADPTLAVKVWRFNYEGWAASANGYNGPFTLGATLDDGILADAITAAKLTAGTIQSADGTTFSLDLNNSILQMGGVYTKAEADAATDAAIGQYVRLTAAGLEIGEAGNNIKLVETANKVAFVDSGSGNEVAYISNDRFYAPNLTVEQTADFGGYRMNVSNGIAFKWVGRA